MKVCVVGGGGREHVLAHVLARSADVVVTPGNAGIPKSTAAPPEEVEADLYVIGPEAPLVDGLADRLRAAGKLVFGPGADGAHLEGSKAWMKEVVATAGVPTARYGAFTDVESALDYLRTLVGPYVIKTDGLAAGKGVLVTESLIEAEDDVKAKLSGVSFGDAGRAVVIEEGLSGPELSVLAICDGERALPLEPAQDFKRVDDNDTGPNTGGMGAYSPVPGSAPDLVDHVMDQFIEPTLAALQKEGIDYRGVLYAGLMLTTDGPKLLEYNVRFGDPEAQVVLPRLHPDTDLAELLAQAAAGSLRAEPWFTHDAAVCIVVASPGYPTNTRTGAIIDGVGNDLTLPDHPDVTVFSAAVDCDRKGRLVTAGGRVLDFVGIGATLTDARARAYAAVRSIQFPGMHYRRDIAAKAARLEASAP
ncbi:MAG: phosphoribosylamine--glycine ligase [Acidimicrobiales bacterium]